MTKPGTISLAVFSFTLLLSASLMFSVQPMVGKMLLPIVGGTPAGWIVAMAFFQIMLLAGYLLAHLFSTVTPRIHGILYIIGLLVGAYFLPLSFAGHSFETTPGAWQVFVLLSLTVGVPFIALSATSSTIQRLFTLTKHGSSSDPYFLYVASNLGSFAGLLLYPAIIEPLLALDQQAGWLQYGYFGLLVVALLCLTQAGGKEIKQAEAKTPKPTLKRQLEWMALAFVPSSLLLGVTIYITTDVISAPMVWVLPLALYLLTFVIAFAKQSRIKLPFMEGIHPYIVCIAVFFICLMQASWLGSWSGVVFYLAVFTAIALTCHMRLASLRPAGSHLTSFYLMMSVGGALGGVLNAFIVPGVFNRLIEFPLVLLASCMLNPDFRATSKMGIAFMALLALSVLLVNAPPLDIGVDSIMARMAFSCLLLIVLSFCVPVYGEKLLKLQPLALLALGVFMVSQFVIADAAEFFRARNFYGTIRLYDIKREVDGKEMLIRYMRHGNTIHGNQMLEKGMDTVPTAYYAKIGPLGDIFGSLKPKKVAVLGLGVGATNCHAAPGRNFTFFEIDPEVVTVAQEQFGFLSKCGNPKKLRIKIGDGRLELGKLKGEKFDLLIIDVFTSDSIPSHIVTREALQLYFEHISKGGVLALNISNRYFTLWDMIAATAATLGLETTARFDLREKLPAYASNSIWVVLTRPGELPPALRKDKEWEKIIPDPDFRPWTDNYTNLLSTLSFTGGVKADRGKK